MLPSPSASSPAGRSWALTTVSSAQGLAEQAAGKAWSALSPRKLKNARKDNVQLTEDLQITDPEYLRAISSRLLLRKFGIIFRDNVGFASTFALSRPVASIDIFVSHSWATPGWMKTIGMLYFLNMRRGVVASVAVALLQLALQLAGADFAMSPGRTYAPSGRGEVVSYAVDASLVIPCLVFMIVFVYGQEIPGLPTSTCFLDKCCIHQTDPDLKQKGIRQLGGFLNKSRILLVLWQPEYLTRLWCVYELAAFHYINSGGVGRIVILPLKVPLLAMSLFVFHTLASLIVVVLGPVSVLSEPVSMYVAKHLAPEYQPIYCGGLLIVLMTTGVYLVPSFVLLKFCKLHMEDRRFMLKQMREFRVEDAICQEAVDRAFVLSKIQRWFGSLENFERLVHEDSARRMEQQMEDDGPLPWSTLFVGALSHLFFLMSGLWEPLAHGDWEMMSRFGLLTIGLVCCGDALALRCSLLLAEHGFGGGRGIRRFTEPLAVSAVFGVLNGMNGMVLTESMPVVLFAIYTAVLLVALWLFNLGGMQWLRRRFRSGHTSDATASPSLDPVDTQYTSTREASEVAGTMRLRDEAELKSVEPRGGCEVDVANVLTKDVSDACEVATVYSV